MEPTSTAVAHPAAETLSSSQDPAAIEQSASQVDKELQQKVLDPAPIKKEDPPAGAVNGSAPAENEVIQASDAPVAATTAADEPAQSTIQDVESQTIEEPETEKPKDPEPTPAISPAKSAAQPASASPAQASAPAPSKPSAPKSWASLAAAAHRVPTAVPAPQQSSSAAPAQTKAAPVPAAAPAPAAAAPSPAPAASAAAAPAEASPAKQEDEWTAVGDHKKQQKGAQAAAGAQEGPQTRAYIKNVSENLEPKELRAAMEKFGDITYFDVHKAKVIV